MFIIMKKTRSFDNPTKVWAYCGPTCKNAGIEPGKVYSNFDEAQKDADALGQYNPVGFVVLKVKEENANAKL